MKRENGPELLERGDLPDEVTERAYRDLAKIHRWLGDTSCILRAIRRDPYPVRRILDVGCGAGFVMKEVRDILGADVVGVDIKPTILAECAIYQADAVYEPLPSADVAYSMHLGHHLCESDLVRLIRNVGRFCRRFVLLDLVRHELPLALFRVFIAPFVCPIDAQDGQRSIRRAYTPGELGRIAATALEGTAGNFQLSVASCYIRQVVDISYGGDRDIRERIGRAQLQAH